MLINRKFPYRHKNRIPAFRYLIILPVFLLISCASLPFGQETENENVSEPEPVTHIIYEGDEYIVCQLNGDETSTSLAKDFLGDGSKAWMIEDANEGHMSFEKGKAIIIPRDKKNIGGLMSNGYQTVPVLIYERIDEMCDTSPCLPNYIFDLQMGYLKDNGYRIISMADFLGFLDYDQAIPERSVIITIDDNHISTYNIACPILKKYGFNATLFIDADLIGTEEGVMNWSQIKELGNDGFEIGSLVLWKKGFSSKNDNMEQSFLPKIRTLLLNSKKIIDSRLSQDTIYLVFPFDQYNPSLLNMFNEIGYKIAFTSINGSNPFFADPLALKRYPVSESGMLSFIEDLETFEKASLR
jgi:peptidoglycan/xylan/chitin deacetylase (PgdA/CDA1 family)